MRLFTLGLAAATAGCLISLPALHAQPTQPRMERVADRQPGEGDGPYRRLVIRGAMVIDGSGAPPRGPVDIVIAGNRIESVSGAGTPGLPLAPNREPRGADREIDARRHVRAAGLRRHARPQWRSGQGAQRRLRLSAVARPRRHHGARRRALFRRPTTCRSPDRARSAANTIVAPRLFAYLSLGDVWSGGACARRSRRAPGCAGRRLRAMTASNCSTHEPPAGDRAPRSRRRGG